MIIVLNEIDCDFNVCKGDTFTLVYESPFGANNLISEVVDKETTITKAATFVFTDEDGNCLCPNVCGIFGTELPKELKEAKRVKDLTGTQIYNLYKSGLIKITYN